MEYAVVFAATSAVVVDVKIDVVSAVTPVVAFAVAFDGGIAYWEQIFDQGEYESLVAGMNKSALGGAPAVVTLVGRWEGAVDSKHMKSEVFDDEAFLEM